jgi:hypothetical protein
LSEFAFRADCVSILGGLDVSLFEAFCEVSATD